MPARALSCSYEDIKVNVFGGIRIMGTRKGIWKEDRNKSERRSRRDLGQEVGAVGVHRPPPIAQV